MGDLVQFTKSGNIGVITINNPPVNALSPGVPEGISESIDQLHKDDGLKAAVLIGGGSTVITALPFEARRSVNPKSSSVSSPALREPNACRGSRASPRRSRCAPTAIPWPHQKHSN